MYILPLPCFWFNCFCSYEISYCNFSFRFDLFSFSTSLLCSIYQYASPPLQLYLDSETKKSSEISFHLTARKSFFDSKNAMSSIKLDFLGLWKSPSKTAGSLRFTVIRKYSQQLINNADKQGASKSREHITFISGRFSAFLLRNRMPFLRVDI